MPKLQSPASRPVDARAARNDTILDRARSAKCTAHFVDPDFETLRGIGFATWKDGAHVFAGHGSACPGFRTAFTLDPEKRVGVVVIANAIHLWAGGPTHHAAEARIRSSSATPTPRQR